MIVTPLTKFPLASFIVNSTFEFPVFKISIIGIPSSPLLDSQVLRLKKTFEFLYLAFSILLFRIFYLAFSSLLCHIFCLAFSSFLSRIF